MCSSVGRASDPKVVSSSLATFKVMIRDSIVASIPACHAGDQGSIPCDGVSFLFGYCFLLGHNVPKKCINRKRSQVTMNK